MNKKKLFVLLPAVMLALTGCGETTDQTSSTQPTTTDTTVVPVAQPVSITAEHGSVVADKTEALPGETVKLTVSVDDGYHFVDLKVNGSSVVVNDNVANVTMVEGGLNVTLVVEQDTHNVVINSSEHGTVTADKTKAVVGEEVRLTVSPVEDYEIDKLLVNGAEVVVNDNIAFVNMVEGGLVVSATFKLIKYGVTIKSIEHGDLVADKTEAARGETITFTATPDADYRLAEIKVNGVAIEGTTYVMGKENIIVEASFVAIDYSVTISTMEHGSVTANVTEAAVGEDVVLTVAADDDYELGQLLVNGTKVDVSENTATVQMVSGGLTVSATFVNVKHAVTIEAMENGSVTADKMEAITGEDVIFTVTPAAGFNIESIKVNGEDVPKLVDNKFTVKMVKGGLTVSATFTDFNFEAEVSADLITKVEAADSYKIRLADDVETSMGFPLAKETTVVDLNGKTLTVTSQNFVDGKVVGQNIKFMNGKIVYKAVQTETHNLFNVWQADEFTLDGVELVVENNLLGVDDVVHASKATTVNILNSTIDAKAAFVIGYNNRENAQTVAVGIRVENSTITTTTADKDNTAIIGNIEGMNVIIKNSVIKADRQAVMARCGTWTIEDSTFETTGEFLNTEAHVTLNNGYLTEGKWKSGNEVPVGAVVIGDQNTSAYKDAVTVNAKNVNAIGDIVIRSDDFAPVVTIDAMTYMNTFGHVDVDATEILFSNVKFMTIPQMNALTEDDDQNLYVVSGYVGTVTNTTYGNTSLSDDEGNTLTVYGSYSVANYSDNNGTLVFSKTGSTALDKTYEGKYVTMMGKFKNYNGTKEIVDAYVVPMQVAASVSVSVNDEAMGSVTLSKTEGVMVGDEITVTATPAEGYKVSKVTVTDANGNEEDITSSLKFNAKKVNNVVVEFIDASAVVAKTFNVAFNGTNNKSSISGYTNSWENSSDGMTFTIKNCNNNKNGWEFIRAGSKNAASVASIQNKDAFTNAIGKTSITIGSRYGSVVSFKLIVASDAEFTNVIEEHDLSAEAGLNKTIETEITTPTKGAFYKYEISISKASNGCVEISGLSFEEVL